MQAEGLVSIYLGADKDLGSTQDRPLESDCFRNRVQHRPFLLYKTHQMKILSVTVK